MLGPEPLYVTAMKAIAERLATIHAGTVVYSEPELSVEYSTTPVTITRSMLGIEQYRPEQLPLIGVVRSSWTDVKPLTHDAPAVYGHEFIVRIVGYVLGDHETVNGGVIATDRLAMLYDDIRTALTIDRSLGGIVEDSQPTGAVETDDGLLEPYGMFEQAWLLRA